MLLNSLVFCRQYFIDKTTDQILTEGATLKRANLANTLRVLLKEGYKAFYGGKLGRQVIEELKKLGSEMTLQDLQEYK